MFVIYIFSGERDLSFGYNLKGDSDQKGYELKELNEQFFWHLARYNCPGTCCIAPKTSKCVPGPAFTTWLATLSLGFVSQCVYVYASCLQLPPSSQLSYSEHLCSLTVDPEWLSPHFSETHSRTYHIYQHTLFSYPSLLFWGHLNLPQGWMCCPPLYSLYLGLEMTSLARYFKACHILYCHSQVV